MRHIYRASFARFTVYSSTEPARGQTCDECGQTGRHGKYEVVRRYQANHDGGRTDYIGGKFCSANCCKGYHGISDRWGEL